MAVTAVLTRNHATTDTSTFTEICTAALTGTYVTGGFTFNPFSIFGGPGSSPLPSSNLLYADWFSPLGYRYFTSVAGNVATTKIYGVAGTELSAGALPDASVQVILRKRKI